MSKTQNPAPEAPVATTSEAGRMTGRRPRTTRARTDTDTATATATATAAPVAVDPVAEEMRAQAVTAVTIKAAAAEDFDGTAVLTLEQLVDRHGQATVEETGFYLEGLTLEQLTSDGAGVATSRLTRDGARIWGTISAFIQRATLAQRALIPTVTDDFLRVAIWSMYQGQLAVQALTNANAQAASARTGREASSRDLRRQGGEQRDVLYTGLLILAGGKRELRSRIEQAYRKSTQPADVATSLRGLVKLGREVLADASPAAVQRRRGSLITAEYLTETDALATDVEISGREAAAVPEPPPMSQADVDLWDGRNLAFLELAINAFAAGHAIDPSIPRPVAISLRSVLGPRRRASRTAPPPSTPSTPAQVSERPFGPYQPHAQHTQHHHSPPSTTSTTTPPPSTTSPPPSTSSCTTPPSPPRTAV